jgi:hypothetical protein
MLNTGRSFLYQAPWYSRRMMPEATISSLLSADTRAESFRLGRGGVDTANRAAHG